MQTMNVSITHVGGTSWLHRLSPLAKLTWVIAVMAFAFASYNPWPLFAIALLGIVLGASAGILGPMSRVLLVFAPVTASMLVIQAIAPAICSTDCTPAAQLGPLTIYEEGISHGLSLMSRVLAMEVIAIAVLMTTHPSDLFSALARLHVPYVLNFMLAMTLQLIPVLQREVQVVLSAQRSRGMKSTGFGSLIPSFVPVFAGAFERVQQLAISLESRAFGSTGTKTSYRQISFGPMDKLIAIAGIIVGVLGTAAGILFWGADQTPVLILPDWLAILIFLVALVMFVGVIVVAIVALVRS
ncbi:MAG TPA: energy-coupling factor transporter transmembrane component T [Candidatus Limnocylindrales bacterium]|jgi:energy-coupling factor transport system permease protein|nr:energy-coupling factor transporter transmembrane component T [Candidatus Limnocylindrales bacterium]